MFPTRLYYRIKPLLPRQIRMAVRRQFALRKLKHLRDVWPILPGSERRPEGWTGWPDGKQFAVVLTHDVEGPEGLAKCRQLMQLEKKLGFRSSFNFIPEGPYEVSRELREELIAEGFEVGVHDLHHDGQLYRSRESFAENAVRINQHLEDWGAVGFRSGFMLRNLDWLHDLNIQYDASTFDTDPFEPQPDGTGTIFPFWVAAGTGRQKSEVRSQKSEGEDQKFQRFSDSATQHLKEGVSASQGLSSPFLPSAFCLQPWEKGYVELPYTLPQDSTLFLLLRQTGPDIWIRKLDWLAACGGMVLVNVHPDYISFDDASGSTRTYPILFYQRLLEHLRRHYEGHFWHPLAKDVASFVSERKPLAPRRPKRIGMVTYSHFLSDARVARYARALAERGDHVDVIALRRTPEAPKQETIGNINLIRLQSRFGKKERTPISFLFPILRFLHSSSLWIAREHTRNRYDLLHIHNIPDFMVFAAWYPRLTGAKVILDIHDIVPEFYASKFRVPDNSLPIRLLKWIEHVSARRADHIIISNHLWRDKYASRTRTEDKCSVFINNVDSVTFRPRQRTRMNDKMIVLFPGGLQWHQGLDIAIRAFRTVVAQLPNAELHIYGDGNMKAQLKSLAIGLELNGAVHFFDPLPVNQIAGVMANADLGIVPKRADSFGNEAYSTKIMEFMSVGVPVVISSTKIDRYYFNNSVARFFESGNSDDMAKAMLEVLRQKELREQMVANGLDYAEQNSWNSRKKDYLNLVDSLVEGKSYLPPDRSPAQPATKPVNGKAILAQKKPEEIAQVTVNR